MERDIVQTLKDNAVIFSEDETMDNPDVYGVEMVPLSLVLDLLRQKDKPKYRVKLLKGHSAKKDQIVDGYLGNSFGNGKVETYDRGDAIKKARLFGGKIEKI